MNSKTEKRTRSDDMEDMDPHNKPNMPSRIGRVIDRATYLDVIVFSCASIILSSIYFTLAPAKHGLNNSDRFFDSLYFSVVTFTTLGYGDIVPVGFGRVVALVVVISGLLLTALLIGKIASERQSSLLLLLHTSDSQRRISTFSKELALVREELENANLSHLAAEVNEHLLSLQALVRALTSYLSFNSFQIGIVEFGNFSALAALYEELDGTFRTCIKLVDDSVGYDDAVMMRRALANCERMHSLVHLMSKFHRIAETRTSLLGSLFKMLRSARNPGEVSLQNATKRKALKLQLMMLSQLSKAHSFEAKGYHPLQVERVLRMFPAGPLPSWERGIHKVVAARLGITNSVTSKCITHLLAQGRLPK